MTVKEVHHQYQAILGGIWKEAGAGLATELYILEGITLLKGGCSLTPGAGQVRVENVNSAPYMWTGHDKSDGVKRCIYKVTPAYWHWDFW